MAAYSHPPSAAHATWTIGEAAAAPGARVIISDHLGASEVRSPAASEVRSPAPSEVGCHPLLSSSTTTQPSAQPHASNAPRHSAASTPSRLDADSRLGERLIAMHMTRRPLGIRTRQAREESTPSYHQVG